MSYTPRYNDDLMTELYKGILELKTIEECQRFFDDLCTIYELQAFSQRLKVAKLLDSGETYTFIEAKTGASTATISRINKFLNSKSGGYRKLLNRLKDKNDL